MLERDIRGRRRDGARHWLAATAAPSRAAPRSPRMRRRPRVAATSGAARPAGAPPALTFYRSSPAPAHRAATAAHRPTTSLAASARPAAAAAAGAEPTASRSARERRRARARGARRRAAPRRPAEATGRGGGSRSRWAPTRRARRPRPCARGSPPPATTPTSSRRQGARGGVRYRVRVGSFPTREAAQRSGCAAGRRAALHRSSPRGERGRLPGRVLITEEELRARHRASSAARSARDYAGQTPILVGVLQGAFLFMADLIRARRSTSPPTSSESRATARAPRPRATCVSSPT